MLVVQPSFIFGNDDNNNTTASDNITEEEDVAVRHSMNYPVGVGLCLYAAGAISLANVVQVFIINDVNVKLSTNHFMLMTGKLARVLFIHYCRINVCFFALLYGCFYVLSH